MTDIDGAYMSGFVCGVIVAVLLIGAFMLIDSTIGKAWKRGHVAALNGPAQYELITNPDSTRTWEKIKE